MTNAAAATRPTEQALRAPRAAGLAGVLFALLLAAAIVLLRTTLPQGVAAAPAPAAGRGAVQAAVALVPFAGISFLWFIGVVRSHVGAAEDRFLATVFLGSGLVFVASMFGSAAAASAVLAAGCQEGGDTITFEMKIDHLSYSEVVER
ncbi:hypothetical protein ABZ861_16910, partial [Streptomyces sp. NPDC046985]